LFVWKGKGHTFSELLGDHAEFHTEPDEGVALMREGRSALP